MALLILLSCLEVGPGKPLTKPSAAVINVSESTEYGFSGEVTSRTFAYTGKEDQTPDFGVNALRSTGDIYFPVLVGIVVMWGVQVVGSYVLGIGLGWGLVAMWAVFALDENIRGLIFLRRWNSFRWVGKGFLK